MQLFRVSLIVVLVLPVALQAQRSRQPQRGNVEANGRQDAPPDLRTKDLENLNPARITLERRKDLDLNADQAARLDSTARAFDLEAKDFGKAIDTLQNVMGKALRNVIDYARDGSARENRERPKSAKDSIERARKDSIDQMKVDKDQERYMAARNALASTLLRIREVYDAKLIGINALLTEDQRRKIGPWFESASDELTARLRAANVR